ncbi:cyclic di-GMP phosphodiesterase [Mangrovibacter phragmitis]|uniref:cyclic di-GMP phosphodiesterase n=1 Tax=Mangrovibacter phragmitis TaxID=1691903 RepID=UPI000A979A9E
MTVVSPSNKLHFFPEQGKNLATSSLLGVVVAICISALVLAITHFQRMSRLDTLANNFSHYIYSYTADLQDSSYKLFPLAQQPCERVTPELTSSVAFKLHVRAALLVKDYTAVCSSATGKMSYPLAKLVPEIDISKRRDLAILPETPLMPGKPALAFWLADPHHPGNGIITTINLNIPPYLLFSAQEDGVTGIALAVRQVAIGIYTGQVTPVTQLGNPRLQRTLQDFPVKLLVFAPHWQPQLIQFSLLAGLAAGILSTLLCFYYLTIRMSSGREILAGIKRHQFSVVYQPVLDTQHQHVKGVEALMRWHHPAVGPIPPDVFIQYAEAQGLIVPLTRHLFSLIVKDLPVLQQCLPAGAKLGINLAPSHLKAASFQSDITQFVSQLPGNYFKLLLEMTERAMLEGDEVLESFNWLHEQGFDIAVDDFGTGHSALIYLQRFPFDYLKIDKGFISTIGQETVTSPVLDAVLNLAQRLKMETVAEGVETADQAAWLAKRGVTYMQGYYLGRPVSAQRLNEWYCKLPSNSDG